MKNTFTSTKFSTNTVHFCLLLLRVGLGLMMLNHGLPKIENFNSMGHGFFDPFQIGGQFTLAIAVFTEVICAGLIILGLFTRWATIPLIIEMVTVIVWVHGSDGFVHQELGAHFLLGLIIIWLLGPGKISLDRMISRS